MSKSKRRNSRSIKKTAFIAVIALTVCAIFFMSTMPPDQSSELSDGFAAKFGKLITKILSLFVGEETAEMISIRKIGHFVEYMILGIECMCFSFFLGKIKIQKLCNITLVGIATAVCDESIQILSGRGPMVKDILLDLTGFVTGTLIVVLIIGIFNLIKKLRK